MSDVKRYDMCGFGGGLVERPEGAWYHMDDFDRVTAELNAALGREAALREENSDLSDALYESEERSASRGRQSSAFEDRMGDLQIQNGKLQDRLTESHQREARLQDMVTAADERLDQAITAPNEIAEVSRMGEKPFEIATLAIGEIPALKPTEGRGDEQ